MTVDATPAANLLEAARRHHLRGELSSARPLYEAHCQSQPDDPIALNLLGTLHHQSGDHERAVTLIERALAVDPGLGSAWQNLVPALLALGRMEAATRAGERAVTHAPNAVGAHVNLALARSRSGDLVGGAQAAIAALAIGPDDVRALSILADIRAKQGREDEATAHYEKALRSDPRDLETLYNFGVHCQAMARLVDAARLYREALALAPGHEGARVNLGAVLRDLGHLDEAIAVWRAGLADVPQSAPMRYNLACGLLLQHRWHEAAAGYELRWEVRDLPKPFAGRPNLQEWDGTSIPGETLIVHHEQGLGDTLQFFRLLPLLRARAGRSVFVCQPRLHQLLQGSPIFAPSNAGTIDLLPEGAALPEARAWMPLLSLPHRLGLQLADLPAYTPSLRPEAERQARWKRRLLEVSPATDRLRIGIAWQGNPLAPAERGRSIPLERLAPLGRIKGISLVCLQKGHGREQLDAHGSTPPMVDLDASLDQGDQSFLDTAALLASLDLVITSDTSMAHLAGALGRPVWTLLKHSPDWRWGVAGALTPWYPTMRLFRQSAPGNWDGVVDEVVAELEQLVATRTEIAATWPGKDSLESAIELHRAGKPAVARQRYLALLRTAPSQPDLLDLLAMASFAMDRSHLPMALTTSSKATSLAPQNPDIHANFAVLLKEAGRHLDAETALRQALKQSPGHAAATQNLANLLIASDRAEEACALVRVALEKAPRHPELVAAFARALRTTGRIAEARWVLRGALEHHGERTDLWLALAAAASDAKDYDEAEHACYRALEQSPDDADALNNLGVIARNRGEEALAIWFYRRALERNPQSAEYWGNLGVAHGEVGDHAAGRHAYARAVALKPDYAEAHMSLGMSHLADGDFAAGLPHYEWRLRVPKLGYRAASPKLEMWQGQHLAGKRILLLTEQGFGDTIQFVRYASVLKSLGAAKVVVGCRARIAALIRTATSVDEVLAEGQSLPKDIDYQAHLLSLPLLTRTRLSTVPAAVPYLQADPELVLRWAQWLARGKGFRVGISWQGNPDPGVDAGRSMALAELQPLARVGGIRLVSLQVGQGTEQIAPLADRLAVECPGPDFDTGADAFLDTAALMASLDLVVTTDTAVAHLAGALGRPTWLLLKAQAEWRWLKRREDSPWYPSMRLFRQAPEPPDGATSPWARVVARLCDELGQLVRGDRRRLVPAGRQEPPPASDTPTVPDLSAVLARHQANDLRAARAGYARILASRPGEALAAHYLGVEAHQQGQAERALYLLQWAQRRGVEGPDQDTNFAVALKAVGRLGEAEALLRKVIDQRPRHGEALLNLANVARDTDRHEEALELIERARAALPGHAKVLRALGNILRDLGRTSLSVTTLQAALDAGPDDAETGIDLAHALLAAGDLEAGFAAYEWRWRSGQMVRPQATTPAWDGRPLAGKRLLILGEQGLGDIIHAARFLAPLAERVGDLTVAVRPAMVALLRQLVPPAKGTLTIVAENELPPHDLHASLFSLPQLLGLRRRDIEALGKPYIQPDQDRLLAWRQRLGHDRRLTVGLVWQGNPVAKADRGRSPPLAALSPLLALDGVRFVALQKEHGLEQLAGSSFGDRIEVLAPALDQGPDAFLDTAAVIALTDLVVTSDTAAAHLAGALGQSAWLMLKYAPDWRWGVGHAHSLWYPSFKLFRQPRPGDWARVASRLAAALAEARDTQSAGPVATTQVAELAEAE